MLTVQTSGPQGGLSRQRIGVNAHLLAGEAGYRRAGIHQYIAQCLRHLSWEEDGPETLIFTHDQAEFVGRPGLTALPSRWPTNRRLVRIVWEQLAGPAAAVRHHLDLWHSAAFVIPAWLPCPAVVTVYDLSFMYYPAAFPAAQRWYLTSQTRRSCRRARRVVAISESGRQDVHHFFGVPLHRIDVVVPGVEPVYRPLPTEAATSFRKKAGREKPFVLHVGTLQPRKNIPVLLAAFAQADLPDHDLVLVGGKGWLFADIFRQVERLGLTERVHFTGYVPDDELPLWYNAADLFVFPSLYEGFGLPVVEAMACGAPVVAANISSIPEAAGEAALLFDPMNAAELAERMTAVLNDAELSATMRARGLRQAARFSWERAGREWTAVYRRALEQP